MHDQNQEIIKTAVMSVVALNQNLVIGSFRRERGAWGKLAGQCVLTARHLLGRRLTVTERRVIWGLLWEHVAQLKD